MMVLLSAILAGLAAQAPEPVAVDGIAIGKRMVAAIKGKSDFQEADFSKPLQELEKESLRSFGKCRLERITYRTESFPKLLASSVADPDVVRVSYACKGVPRDTPVSLSLHLKSGRIASVEMHNADLMRVD